jgi:hypothetical protein
MHFQSSAYRLKGITLTVICNNLMGKLTARGLWRIYEILSAEVMPHLLWKQYFLYAQGYISNESIIYQDNKSAILLENNGNASSSKRTCHINIGYYLVTDWIAKKEVSIMHCPTK